MKKTVTITSAIALILTSAACGAPEEPQPNATEGAAFCANEKGERIADSACGIDDDGGLDGSSMIAGAMLMYMANGMLAPKHGQTSTYASRKPYKGVRYYSPKNYSSVRNSSYNSSRSYSSNSSATTRGIAGSSARSYSVGG